MPEYTMPMFGVIRLILDEDDGSINGDEDFFSVARTIPFVAIDHLLARTRFDLQIGVYL